MTGSATEKNIRSIPMPAANSIDVQVNKLYSGRDSSGPRRYRPYLLMPRKTTRPTIAVARMKYHQPNQRVMKSRTSLMTVSAAAGAASAQIAKASTMAADATKTVRLTELGRRDGSPVSGEAGVDGTAGLSPALMTCDASLS